MKPAIRTAWFTNPLSHPRRAATRMITPKAKSKPMVSPSQIDPGSPPYRDSSAGRNS